MAEQLRLDDVFGVARELPRNYVVRDSVDQSLVDALARDQHIVIYGSSKQGKTCLRKYNLKADEYIACERTGVFGTMPQTIVIQADAAELIKVAVDAHSGRYTAFVINFALGFQTSQLEMFKWLLWPVLTADVEELERGLKYGTTTRPAVALA
jgi:hypothetical protein